MSAVHTKKNRSKVNEIICRIEFQRNKLYTVSLCSTLYWTDWNREAPKIESSSVDGQNRRVVVSDGIGLPNALTYDSSSGQICWADAGKHYHCITITSTVNVASGQLLLLPLYGCHFHWRWAGGFSLIYSVRLL